MTKNEFLLALEQRLAGLPQDEVEERLRFYGEMIDDRIEEGAKEEKAVAAIGSLDEVVGQILSEIPLTKLIKETAKPKRRLTAVEILLLVLGSPLWLSLLVAAVAVVFSLFAVLVSLIVALWAVFGSLVAGACGSAVAGVIFMVTGYGLPGVANVAAALVGAGLSIFLFFGCREATKGIIRLVKSMLFGIKRCFVRKGEASYE